MSIKFRLHHNGCAVKDIHRAITYYMDVMNYTVHTPLFEFMDQNIRVCFLQLPGDNVLLELIEGINEKSPTQKIIKHLNGGVYHSCYIVDDINAAIEYLQKHDFIRMRKKPMENKQYYAAYMLTPDNYLMELIQTKEGSCL